MRNQMKIALTIGPFNFPSFFQNPFGQAPSVPFPPGPCVLSSLPGGFPGMPGFVIPQFFAPPTTCLPCAAGTYNPLSATTCSCTAGATADPSCVAPRV
ncbi:hypothetical protein ACKWTF_015428 [Chironomus riparius]